MQYILICTLFLFSFLFSALTPLTVSTAEALPFSHQKKKNDDVELASHKALYEISLISKSNGSQMVNIKGKMFYDTKDVCNGWVTNHQFNLRYEYADTPGMQILSDFSTYEASNGEDFSFSTRRQRNGKLYEEYRGNALIGDQSAEAIFSVPEDLTFELTNETLFPIEHTKELIRQARDKTKFFKTVVFDGGDNEGPVDINSFIGKELSKKQILTSDQFDEELIGTRAWPVRMAVFPTLSDTATAEYEMTMVFHENGVVSDMHIDYNNFSVRQKLVALEKIDDNGCDTGHKTPNQSEKD